MAPYVVFCCCSPFSSIFTLLCIQRSSSYSVNPLRCFCGENHSRSAGSEILRPAPTTMPSSKWLNSSFYPILMLSLSFKSKSSELLAKYMRFNNHILWSDSAVRHVCLFFSPIISFIYPEKNLKTPEKVDRLKPLWEAFGSTKGIYSTLYVWSICMPSYHHLHSLHCKPLWPLGDMISAGLISLFNWSSTVALGRSVGWLHARLK